MQRQPRAKDLKVIPIGNSRGVRLPKSVLDKYAIAEVVVLEEREEGILLRSKKDQKLTWEETYREMAREGGDWSDLEVTLNDGLKDGGLVW